MSQRDSGYERKERDLYETPAWVTEALMPHLPLESRPMMIWEPACGNGKIVHALQNMGHAVLGTDIVTGQDFLTLQDYPGMTAFDAIITNPPYTIACEFIWQALIFARNVEGLVAMLLRTDFDHAKSREHLFRREQFSKKVVLTKRIKWFEGTKGSPSYNHAWFIWNWKHRGPPTLAYA